jgi:hypothetical protein
MVELFGLWGGRGPGGWCSFKTTAGSTSPREAAGWGYLGTREEAESGRAQFIAEGNDPSWYTVIPFDPDKEPVPDLQHRPSLAQLSAMRMIVAGKHDGWNFHLKVRKATLISLHEHGLVMHDVQSGDLKLTRFGKERLK